jgi:hypothetical protein
MVVGNRWIGWLSVDPSKSIVHWSDDRPVILVNGGWTSVKVEIELPPSLIPPVIPLKVKEVHDAEPV